MKSKNINKSQLTRRQFVQRGAATTASLLLAACGAFNEDEFEAEETPLITEESTAPEPVVVETETTVPTMLEPTPYCDDGDEPTIAQAAGPFYSPNTPERSSFWDDRTNGTKLVVTGRVLQTNCEPMAGAVLDFWHADEQGDYDNATYRFRGHQFTDAQGNYRLETIMPGLYPGRTRHIHVKVQGPNTAVLTTQLYFPDEPSNDDDGIFIPSLLVDIHQGANGQEATFDFVLV